MSAIMRTITLDRNVSGDKLYWDTHYSKLLESFKRAVVGRKFLVTKHGYIGLGPCNVDEDDIIALIPGCHVPSRFHGRGEEMVKRAAIEAVLLLRQCPLGIAENFAIAVRDMSAAL